MCQLTHDLSTTPETMSVFDRLYMDARKRVDRRSHILSMATRSEAIRGKTYALSGSISLNSRPLCAAPPVHRTRAEESNKSSRKETNERVTLEDIRPQLHSCENLNVAIHNSDREQSRESSTDGSPGVLSRTALEGDSFREHVKILSTDGSISSLGRESGTRTFPLPFEDRHDDPSDMSQSIPLKGLLAAVEHGTVELRKKCIKWLTQPHDSPSEETRSGDDCASTFLQTEHKFQRTTAECRHYSGKESESSRAQNVLEVIEPPRPMPSFQKAADDSLCESSNASFKLKEETTCESDQEKNPSCSITSATRRRNVENKVKHVKMNELSSSSVRYKMTDAEPHDVEQRDEISSKLSSLDSLRSSESAIRGPLLLSDQSLRRYRRSGRKKSYTVLSKTTSEERRRFLSLSNPPAMNGENGDSSAPAFERLYRNEYACSASRHQRNPPKILSPNATLSRRLNYRPSVTQMKHDAFHRKHGTTAKDANEASSL